MKLALFFAAPLLSLASPPEVDLQPLPEGGYQPDLAVATDGTGHLIYHTGDPATADILHATYSQDTKTFSTPTRVNSVPNSAVPAGTVRGAQLAIGKHDSLHVAWMGAAKTTSGGDHSKTPMLYTRSLDAGKSFSPQRNLIATHYGLDGGGTITADPTGDVHVLWHATGDVPCPDTRQVIIASSADNGTTFAPDRPLPFDTPTGACPCCGIRSTTSPDGIHIVTLLRGATGAQRDALLTAFDPRTNKTRILLNSPWTTESCPMSTATFTTTGSTLAVAWEQQERIKVALLNDRPHTLTLPSHDMPQKHPALALAPDGSLFLAWVKPAGWAEPGTLHWQHYDSSGKPTATKNTKTVHLPVWSRPALAQTASGITLFF